MLLFIAGCIFTFSFLVWFFLKADADLTLLWKERYGKKLDNLNGQVIWITGASSGIGESLAYFLASVNAKLVLSGTNLDRLQKVMQRCLENSSIKSEDILFLPFNIADVKVHEEKFKAVLHHFGKVITSRLDILVNNAGRSQRASFQDIDLDVHRELFDVNVFGPVNLSKIVLPYFIENKSGHFVITSSTTGIFGAPFSATYCASKHAMHGYFETLRAENFFNGIDVTICCPGPVVSNVIKNCYTGKLGEACRNTENPRMDRMKTSRCAELMAIAIVNKLDHAWISNNPVLLSHYCAQYCPSVFRNFLLKHVSKKYMNTLRGGIDQSSL